jgi:hypothetical protein
MKKMMLGIFLLCLMSQANAQGKRMSFYKYAVGAFFQPAGLSVKMEVLDADCVQALAMIDSSTYRFAGLYHVNIPIRQTGIRFFVGAGFQAGFWRDKKFKSNTDGYMIFGICGTAGVEYKIPKAPISISLQYLPTYDLAGHQTEIHGTWGGGAIYFTF